MTSAAKPDPTMIDVGAIREDPDRVRKAMHQKGFCQTECVDKALQLDQQRREILSELHEAQAEANTISDKIGELKREGREEQAQRLIEKAAELKEQVTQLETEAKNIEARLKEVLLEIPNVPHPSVPVGDTPEENVVAETWKEKPKFDFKPYAHWELAEHHGLVDFERGAKVAGSGFPFYVGEGVRLQRALIAFFLDLAVDAGYTEMQPPIFTNADSARGTGQLPDKEDQMYEVPRDGFYPIPTAEVPVTNFFREEILSREELPAKFCAYTPCFRREAGSYGQDVRGLNRLHQFDKVELVQIAHPGDSYEALEELRADAERALRLLGLPYRRVLMCTGDMGFAQAKKYDLEVWSAGQERWLEVSSISNFETFQARRMAIRFRPESEAKPELVHTLNGSGLALPRVVAALLEHYQQPDKTVLIPEVLQPFMGCERIGERHASSVA